MSGQTGKPVPPIEKVREFWNAHPLWVGDGQAAGAPGTKEFFESHTRACLADAGGRMDPRFYPVRDGAILDLGCGIGYWLEDFGERGYRDLTGADISQRSLDLAALRCRLFGIPAKFSLQNAQALTFADASFDHVQSMGVIHHSPDPQASLREIHRVLRPGGRAVVSVYYKNFVLRHWSALSSLVSAAGAVGFSHKGRGRDDMMRRASSAEDLVRHYDGKDNPFGIAFTRREYRDLIERSAPWIVRDMITHDFPRRALPFRVSDTVYRAALFLCPMMICAVLTKREAGGA